MIKIDKVVKKYNEIIALNSMSLSIEKKELFGLLGPNGAGKSTLINLLTSYQIPDSGEIFINDFHLPKEKHKIQKLIGLVPQEISLYEELTGYENLLFWGSLYNLKRKKLKKKAEEILNRVGLYDRRNDIVKNYSGGMKRRINIASGLLHDPEVIFLDEPTVGVDPQSRNFIYDFITELNQQGKTIIYTSHYMEEIEKLCTKIGIIDHGKIIALGTRKDLYKLLGEEDNIQFHFKGKIEIKKFNQLLKKELVPIGEKAFKISEKGLIKTLPIIIKSLEKTTDELDDIIIVQPNLEQVFLSLTGKELRE